VASAANPLNMMTATGTDYLAGKQDTLPGGFGPSKGFGFADDVLVTPNQAGSQWDGLAHIFWRGQLYNGFDAGHVTSQGAGRCGIEVHRTSFVMRGVPLDVARYKGVDCLEAGYAIIADDLDATAAAQQVEVGTGDALIVRTGMTETRRANWGDYNGGASPGLCLHTAPWLYAHEVAAIATDTWGCEVRPNEIDLFQPLHIIALVQMGISGRSGTSRRSAATARRTACTSSCSPLHRSHHRGGGLPGERAGGKVAPAGPAGRATFPAPRRTRAAGVQARTSIRCSAPRAPRRACRR